MRKKIFLSLFALLMLFATGALIHILHMRNTTMSMSDIIRLSQVDHLRQDLIRNIQTVQSNFYTARTPLAEDLDFVVSNVSALDATVKRCNACHHSPEITSRISEVQSLVEDYKTALSSYITASADLKKMEGFKNEASVIGNKLIWLSQKMTVEANEHLEQKTKNALSEVGRTKVLLLITIGLTALFAVLISLHLINAITRPVNELVKATRAVGAGDLNYEITYQDKTEFGELAKSFNEMTAALKKSYESIEKQQQEISESERKFRTLSEFAYDWEYWISEDEKIIFMSPSCERITGYTREDFMQNPEIRNDMIYPYDKALWEKHADDFRSPGPEEIEFRIIAKDGQVKWLSHTCAPVYNKGVFLGRRVSNRDITDRKLLEEQLMQSQKLESIGTLAGGIAHDFNNILTAIIGYASILKMKIKEGDPLRHNIEQILVSAERAANLTQSILVFSRQQKSNLQSVDLKDTIKSVENILFRVIGENIKLKISLPDKDLTVMADSSQIEQVLMNLCTNARDAMPEGGMLTIRAELIELDTAFIGAHGYGKAGTYALISVTDTGTGMDGEISERIFEPFFTTKEVGKGTGLGLSMVHGIIQQHGGYVRCYSEPGIGTTFKVYLPVIGSKITKTMEMTETAELKGGAETILLAEDEEMVRNLTRQVLEGYGYKVLAAVDGEDAVSKFMENKDRVELLVFDVVMPKMNGREAYAKIKDIKPDIKVLFASGYPSDFVHKQEILEQKLDFISKPAPPAALLRKVREVLDKDR